MGFDLLENPFAVLRLATDASPAALNARARELGGATAATAARILLVPNARVQAEVSFLPGLTETEIAACLARLAERRAPELTDLLPLAQANVLAHLASCGAADAGQLRALIALEAELQTQALGALNGSRAAAGMPPVPAPMFAAALEHLQGQHADAVSAGAQALPDGAEVLLDLVRALGPAIGGASIFVRHAVTAWERATSSVNADEIERASDLEIKLAQRPSEEAAAQLSALICSVAARTKPPRELARHFGLGHKMSSELCERWRSLAVDVANLYDAFPEALGILAALADGFGVTDELGEQVAEDLALCRERVASGAYVPEMRRLRRAIAAAGARGHDLKPEMLARLMRKRPRRRDAPAVAVELCDAFAAAVRTAQTDLPWQALREFAQRLYAEQSSADSALALVELALRTAQAHPQAQASLPALQKARGVLAEHALRAQLADATTRRQRGRARQIIRRLVSLSTDEQEQLRLLKTLRWLRWQSAALLLKRSAIIGVAAAVAVVAYAILPGEGAWETASGYERPTAMPLAVSNDPTSAQADDGREEQPPPDATALSRAQLRWCRFQAARLDAEKAYLQRVENDPYVGDAAFSAAVVGYGHASAVLNDACGQRAFDRADDAAVAAERADQDQTLRDDGVQLAEIAFDRAPLPRHAASASASASTSVARLVGQLDRRAWDAWLGGLNGAYKQGALGWASMRTKQPRPSCEQIAVAAAVAADRAAAVDGCNAARERLTPQDRRKRIEPAYRAGWDHP